MIFGPFEAFLFDQDGTLIDSEFAHWKAWRNLAQKYGFTITEDIVRKTQGTTDTTVAKEILPHLNVQKSIQEIVQEKKQMFEEIVDLIPLMPGAQDILLQAKEQSAKIALVTASPKKQTIRVLENHNIMHFFDAVITREDIPQGKNKPNPDIYLKAAQVLNINPELCCVFEDSDTGTLAAKSAQMFCIAIPNPAIAHRDFTQADACVKALKNIEIKENAVYLITS